VALVGLSLERVETIATLVIVRDYFEYIPSSFSCWCRLYGISRIRSLRRSYVSRRQLQLFISRPCNCRLINTVTFLTYLLIPTLLRSCCQREKLPRFKQSFRHVFGSGYP
jgi:hypothetical protein